MSADLRAEIEQWAKDWSDENSFDPGMEGLGELHAILDHTAIRTATPTPAPPLVDVIAGVLAEHQWYDATNELDGLRFGCACLIDDEGNETALLTETPSAHQARAVLDAISEAGAVEWATEHVAQGSRTIEIHPCDSEADAQGAIAYYGGRILSRITGPWTAVQG